MKLNRKTRRARGTWRRPSPTDTPQQQMKAFLKAPGKFHIVQLPEGKSFVVKVTDAEMPIFLTICQQLRGVLGQCDAIPATPVEASVADTTEIAQQTGEATRRIREARTRTEPATAPAQTGQDDLNATIARHPAGKPRGGRHRANEPDTTFDRLVAAGPVDNDEGARRLAAMEIAAAQQQVAAAQDQLEAANERLRDAYDRGGELHNRSVLDRFAERAGQAIAEQPEPGHFPEPEIRQADAEPTKLTCPLCPAEIINPDRIQALNLYAHHIRTSHAAP